MLILRQKSFEFCTPHLKTPQPVLPYFKHSKKVTFIPQCNKGDIEYWYFGPDFAFIINNIHTYLEKVTYWIEPSKFIVFDWQTHICLNRICYHWVYYAFKSKVSDIADQKHTSPSFIHHSIYCINKKRIGLCPGILCCRLKRENWDRMKSFLSI